MLGSQWGISVHVNELLWRLRPQMNSPSVPLGREKGNRIQSIPLSVSIAMTRQATSTGRWRVVFSKFYQNKFLWKDGFLDL